MRLQSGIYHLFLRKQAYHLADIDQNGNVLNIPETIIKRETVELIIDQMKKGINKAQHLTCATLNSLTGRAKYVDLVRLLVDGVEEVPSHYRTETDKLKKAKPIGQRKYSQKAARLLRKSGLTKRELAKKLGVTFRKVDGVMEGRSEIPPGWERYLKNQAIQCKEADPVG